MSSPPDGAPTPIVSVNGTSAAVAAAATQARDPNYALPQLELAPHQLQSHQQRLLQTHLHLAQQFAQQQQQQQSLHSQRQVQQPQPQRLHPRPQPQPPPQSIHQQRQLQHRQMLQLQQSHQQQLQMQQQPPHQPRQQQLQPQQPEQHSQFSPQNSIVQNSRLPHNVYPPQIQPIAPASKPAVQSTDILSELNHVVSLTPQSHRQNPQRLSAHARANANAAVPSNSPAQSPEQLQMFQAPQIQQVHQSTQAMHCQRLQQMQQMQHMAHLTKLQHLQQQQQPPPPPPPPHQQQQQSSLQPNHRNHYEALAAVLDMPAACQALPSRQHQPGAQPQKSHSFVPAGQTHQQPMVAQSLFSAHEQGPVQSHQMSLAPSVAQPNNLAMIHSASNWNSYMPPNQSFAQSSLAAADNANAPPLAPSSLPEAHLASPTQKLIPRTDSLAQGQSTTRSTSSSGTSSRKRARPSNNAKASAIAPQQMVRQVPLMQQQEQQQLQQPPQHTAQQQPPAIQYDVFSQRNQNPPTGQAYQHQQLLQQQQQLMQNHLDLAHAHAMMQQNTALNAQAAYEREDIVSPQTATHSLQQQRQRTFHQQQHLKPRPAQGVSQHSQVQQVYQLQNPASSPSQQVRYDQLPDQMRLQLGFQLQQIEKLRAQPGGSALAAAAMEALKRTRADYVAESDLPDEQKGLSSILNGASGGVGQASFVLDSANNTSTQPTSQMNEGHSLERSRATPRSRLQPSRPRSRSKPPTPPSIVARPQLNGSRGDAGATMTSSAIMNPLELQRIAEEQKAAEERRRLAEAAAISDRKRIRLENAPSKDQKGVLFPDYRTPFVNRIDAWQRLLPYHCLFTAGKEEHSPEEWQQRIEKVVNIYAEWISKLRKDLDKVNFSFERANGCKVTEDDLIVDIYADNAERRKGNMKSGTGLKTGNMSDDKDLENLISVVDGEVSPSVSVSDMKSPVNEVARLTKDVSGRIHVLLDPLGTSSNVVSSSAVIEHPKAGADDPRRIVGHKGGDDLSMEVPTGIELTLTDDLFLHYLLAADEREEKSRVHALALLSSGSEGVAGHGAHPNRSVDAAKSPSSAKDHIKEIPSSSVMTASNQAHGQQCNASGTLPSHNASSEALSHEPRLRNEQSVLPRNNVSGNVGNAQSTPLTQSQQGNDCQHSSVTYGTVGALESGVIRQENMISFPFQAIRHGIVEKSHSSNEERSPQDGVCNQSSSMELSQGYPAHKFVQNSGPIIENGLQRFVVQAKEFQGYGNSHVPGHYPQLQNFNTTTRFLSKAIPPHNEASAGDVSPGRGSESKLPVPPPKFPSHCTGDNQ